MGGFKKWKSFPHYHGNLETKYAEKIYNLHLTADGIHKFPENFFS